MQVETLDRLESGAELDTDLLVIGGGPAGLSIAREFFGTRTRVLVVESGLLEEVPQISALNQVESTGEPTTDLQVQRRIDDHGAQCQSWSAEMQPYGVRCRVLGGASLVWAGKSAPLTPIDFRLRDWAPNSGWPFGPEVLTPYLARAAEALNLGPTITGDEIWDLIGAPRPGPHLDPALLESFFWQFSRSTTNAFEATRFGPDFVREKAPNVRVLLGATITRIDTDPQATRFVAAEAASLLGKRVRIRARFAVLAASAIENVRLLLASNHVVTCGLGNQNDVVGRYLLDHPSAVIARFDREGASVVHRRFGFQGVSDVGGMHMYMHGLALPPALQERERLLNAALFMLDEFSPDDPILALKRLRSRFRWIDVARAASAPVRLGTSVVVKAMQSGRIPLALQNLLIKAVVRVNPNFAVREALHRGVQYKLDGLRVEAITEQTPDQENRITLSEARDALGVPRARVHWSVDPLARRSLLRLGTLMRSEFARVGLPEPQLEDWVLHDRPSQAPVIDRAHTMGCTRMSDDPRRGVVDRNCRVHSVEGLFIAGGSVFPTSGHCNPTLTIVALAVRLADHLKATLAAA